MISSSQNIFSRLDFLNTLLLAIAAILLERENKFYPPVFWQTCQFLYQGFASEAKTKINLQKLFSSRAKALFPKSEIFFPRAKGFASRAGTFSPRGGMLRPGFILCRQEAKALLQEFALYCFGLALCCQSKKVLRFESKVSLLGLRLSLRGLKVSAPLNKIWMNQIKPLHKRELYLFINKKTIVNGRLHSFGRRRISPLAR